MGVFLDQWFFEFLNHINGNTFISIFFGLLAASLISFFKAWPIAPGFNLSFLGRLIVTFCMGLGITLSLSIMIDLLLLEHRWITKDWFLIAICGGILSQPVFHVLHGTNIGKSYTNLIDMMQKRHLIKKTKLDYNTLTLKELQDLEETLKIRIEKAIMSNNQFMEKEYVITEEKDNKNEKKEDNKPLIGNIVDS